MKNRNDDIPQVLESIKQNFNRKSIFTVSRMYRAVNKFAKHFELGETNKTKTNRKKQHNQHITYTQLG